MKRLLSLCLCLFFFGTLPLSVRAEEGDLMPEEYKGFLEAFPDEVTNTLPRGLSSDDPAEVAEALAEFGNFPSILTLAKELFLQVFDGSVKLFFFVLGLLLLSRILKETKDAFSLSGGIASAYDFLKKLLLLSLLLGSGYQSLSIVTDYLSILGNLTRAAIPLLGTLYAMGGNVSAAVASSGGLSASLAITEQVVGASILPLCALCLGLCLVELFTPFPTKSLSDSMKKNYTTLLSFLMVILLALLGGQTALGAKADTLAAKSAKFAAGTLIPVAGGSVSELLLSVGSGVSYLRGVCGICGLLLLLLSLLSPLLTLFCHRLLWQASESVSDLLGCPDEKRLFSEFSSLCGYLITALLICSSALFLSLILTIKCIGAWG